MGRKVLQMKIDDILCSMHLQSKHVWLQANLWLGFICGATICCINYIFEATKLVLRKMLAMLCSIVNQKL